MYLGYSHNIELHFLKQNMNEFSLVKRADAEVFTEIDGWLNKIVIYLGDFFNGDLDRVRSTEFGDCISKVNYLYERVIAEPSKFRGAKDGQGRLQAGAIVEPYFNYLDVDTFTNAPWNVLKNQPETVKGAATSLFEELVKESFELGFAGSIKLVAIKRARAFYTKIGLTQSNGEWGEMELTPTAAQRFLEQQRSRRRT